MAPVERRGQIVLVIDPTWGDNGKGRILDAIARGDAVVARFAGGDNAGHSVTNIFGEFKLHLIPSGIFNPEAFNVITSGVVVNPSSLIKEIRVLQEKGVVISPQNFLVSENAHLIMPWHLKRDTLKEVSRGKGKIGTTAKGIGPTYSDRSDRVGLRVRNLFDSDFQELFDMEYRWQERLTRLMQGELLESELVNEQKEARSLPAPYDREKILEELRIAREVLRPMTGDALKVLWDYQDAGRSIIGEGAQGGLLDLDTGGYPYVSSSNTGVCGFTRTTGIQDHDIDRVIAVSKSFTTRVGEGPMPTEDTGELGNQLRGDGSKPWDEFGATTRRPRRCGWLDTVLLRYGIRTSGARTLALTKLDILDQFNQIGICVGYKNGNMEYRNITDVSPEFLYNAEPIIEYIPGWEQDTTGIRTFSDLPQNAQDAVLRIEKEAGKPVEYVSVGPARDALIYRHP
jgi:adenylosuccinate synthase